MSKYSYMTDFELAEQIAGQDHAAFTELYERHWKSLFIYVRSILQDSDEASDVVQNVFTTIWNRASKLQINTNVKGYLLTAARNNALRIISRSTRADQYAAELAQSFNEETASTDEHCNFRELCSILDHAVDNLPSTMRAVYIRSKHEERSHQSIAEELGITEQSSRTLLNRAMNSLRLKLTIVFVTLLFNLPIF